MEFHLLGPIEVEVEGEPVALGGPKQRAVLAALLLQANHLVAAEALIDALWGDEPPETARNTLQGYVSHLRRALGDGRLEGRAPGYVLHARPGEIDALRFEELVREARGLLPVDPARASELIAEALALWRGPPLADVVDDAALSGEAARLEESRLSALEDRVAADLELGRHAELVAELESLTERHPLRERAWGHLMRALYGAGRQADALRAYQRLRELLGEELGLDPSPELARLQERILVHDPTLAPATEAGPEGQARNPFKGLRPFDEDDAADFFGREELVDRLVGLLEGGTRLLALVGPSGSGKSSVMHAGLIPALRSQHGAGPPWAIARLAPGRRPFDDLRTALESVGGEGDGRSAPIRAPRDRRLLIAIDQFEQLFLVSDEADRSPFLDALASLATGGDEPGALVLTLRADFYDRPLLHPTFARPLTEGLETVLPMTAEEIERAVVAPARRVGVEVEGALLADLVADTAERPNALPLLQYALTEVFDRRGGRALTSAAYQELGGLRGTISRRAEALYERLDQQQRDVLFQAFLRLVRLGESTGDAARRVPIGELTALDLDTVALAEGLEAFGRHRLLTFDRDPVTGEATVQIAHEALLVTWERLASWVDRHRSDLTRHASFVHGVEEWAASGEHPDYLLTGSRVEQADGWSRDTTLRLTELERRYLDASLARHRAQEADERARDQQRRRLEHSARSRLIALVVALGVALAASAFVLLAWLGSRPPEVALVFEGLGVAGFQDAIATGFDRAIDEHGIRGEKVHVPIRQFGPEIQRLSEEGVDLVVTLGADCSYVVEPVARRHPETRYLVLDCVGELPANVSAIWFESEEGSFLAGAAAALTSESGRIGFVGGVDIPLIWAFSAGFEAGARYVDPTIEVSSTYLTPYPDFSGFISPELALRASRQMYREGADVVYHAAGGAGIGVYQAAAAGSTDDRHLWAIGVDVDEYRAVLGLDSDNATSWRPHLLTSMVKRLEETAYQGITAYAEGQLRPGVVVAGLAEGAVDIVYSGGFLDEHRATLERIRSQIISGEIQVPSVPDDRKLVAADFPPELIPP